MISIIDACGPLTESEETTAAQMRDTIMSRHTKSPRNKLRIVDLDDAVKPGARYPIFLKNTRVQFCQEI